MLKLSPDLADFSLVDTSGRCERQVPDARPALVGLLDLVGGLGRKRLVVAAALLTLVVAMGDYITGPDVSFSVFYLIPIFLAAGTAGGRAGVLISGLAAIEWFAADLASREHAYATVLVPTWNASVRFLMFWLVAALVASLRDVLEHERQMSRTDVLSGLPNTRGFFDAASVELARARRTRRPFSVAYLDLDDFKDVNDTLGHAEGDEVIARVGELIRAGVRSTDVTGRLGGDEFAILLPETDAAGAEAVLRPLHESLQSLARSNRWPIGCSVGVVTFDRQPRSMDDVLHRADQLMYAVKQSGKRSVRFEVDRVDAGLSAAPVDRRLAAAGSASV